MYNFYFYFCVYVLSCVCGAVKEEDKSSNKKKKKRDEEEE
jgi:hypothetical protein